jgi:hypothetical protein
MVQAQDGAIQAEKPGSGNSAPAVLAISLPKGGGAIRGMGKKFAANPVTGTGSICVPIATSPGRSGFGPQLSLSYDSGADNGPFGFSWSLALPAITRKADRGLPQYFDAEESDVFILSGAEDLAPEFEKDNTGKWVIKDGQYVVHDKPRTVNNVTYNARRYRPRIEGLFARIERWTSQTNPQETFWRSISKDNIATWYGEEDNSRIADPAGPARIFSWLICESYDHNGNAVVYRHQAEDSTKVVLWQAHGRNRKDSGRSANRYLKRSLPPVEFEYTQPIVQDVDAASLENLPIGLDGAAYQGTDLNGEGIPGILTKQAGAWLYKRNLSPINGVAHIKAKFAPMELVATRPNLALDGGAQFMDLAGDGQPDLVVLDGPVSDFYEHDDAERWQPFHSFTARLNRDMRDPHLRFVDLDGDGHADVLITEDDAFVWHPSLAEDGFGPARRVHQVLEEELGQPNPAAVEPGEGPA